MEVTAIVLGGWVVGSVPLAVLVGRLLRGADRIAVAAERPERRVA